MNSERARWITLMVYLVCLTLSIVLLFVKQFLQHDFDVTASVVNLLGLYSVPLAIIVTAISSFRAPKAAVTGTTLVLLFGSTLLWNALVVGALIYFVVSSVLATASMIHFSDPQAQGFLASVPGKLTFLISGALTYFFVGDTSKPTET